MDNETNFRRLTSSVDISTESGADYILPDYSGDIRKILYTECKVRPAGKFPDGGSVAFSGVVVYSVVYLDAEGKLSSASFTSDYEMSAKRSEEASEECYAAPRVASYTIRSVGPRKLSGKATVSSSVKVTASEALAACGSAFEHDARPEMAERVLKMQNILESEGTEREYAESLAMLEGAIADDVNVLHSGAEVSFDSAEAVEDGARVAGELRLWAVIENGDDPIYVIQKTIPIAETVPFPDVNAGMRFYPIADVVSLVSNVRADEAGSEVVLSAIIEYRVFGEYNEEIRAIKDAYLKNAKTENEYKDYRYSELVDLFRAQESVSFEAPRSELSSEVIREIVYLDAEPKIESAVCEGGAVSLSGEMKFSGIATEITEEGGVAYSPIRLSLPFSKAFKCSSAREEHAAECNLSCSRCGAVIDGERVEISCSLEGVITVSDRKSERILSSSNVIDDELNEHPGRVTVYYPEPGETLFSVAKKFHASVEKVALDNALDVETASSGDSDIALSGVKKLLIY